MVERRTVRLSWIYCDRLNTFWIIRYEVMSFRNCMKSRFSRATESHEAKNVSLDCQVLLRINLSTIPPLRRDPENNWSIEPK